MKLALSITSLVVLIACQKESTQPRTQATPSGLDTVPRAEVTAASNSVSASEKGVMTCASVAEEAFTSLAEVEAFFKALGPELAKHPDRHLAGISPEHDWLEELPAGEDSLSGARGVMQPERLESMGVFSVDRQGVFSATLEGQELIIPKSVSERVKAVCLHHRNTK